MAARRERAALFRLLRLPELCPACRGPSEGGFCGECARGFRTLPRPCRICGLPGGGTCRRHDAGWAVARTRVVFEYAEPLAHYLQALKFGHGRALGRTLGLLLAAALNEDGEHADMPVDALVPVPLSRRRLRERGYNQAVEIARAFGREKGVALVLGGVERPLDRRAQVHLGARERRLNVAEAFRVRRSFGGMRLAIVDDVVTTGATINALAAALLAAGAERVEAVAVARTVAPDRRFAPGDGSAGQSPAPAAASVNR